MPDAARPVRFALAGVRHFHIFDLVAALAAREDAELVAAAEDDADAAAAAHARGVEFTHRTVDELLAEPEQFDVLAVGDYYARRGSLAIRALELGKHVLLDKPICIDLPELDRIAALSRGPRTRWWAACSATAATAICGSCERCLPTGRSEPCTR